MNGYSTLETVILAALSLVIIWWWGRGLPGVFERSRDAPKDWSGVLIPLAFVVAFVIFLILIS